MNDPRFTVLISASVPSRERSEQYLKVPNAQINIEDAVVALARSIFNAGGSIIMGGHPSITPLLSVVATEFPLEKRSEKTGNEPGYKRLVIYQSKAFENVVPASTLILSNTNYAEIVWVDAVNDEVYIPDKKGTQCRSSLSEMRYRMMKANPDAMICLGGMEGIEEEFKLFSDMNPHQKIYLFPQTGGATFNMSRDRYYHTNMVRIIDEGNVDELLMPKKEKGQNLFSIYPYSVIAAEVTEEIRRDIDRLNRKT